MTIKIYNMDVLKALRLMPNKSIDMQICSPPYWALRDYGPEVETIWDETGLCEHEFELEIQKNPMDRGGMGQHDVGGIVGKMGKDINSGWERPSGEAFKKVGESKVRSGYCKKCFAWKGQLGLEPDFKDYIRHLCDIFDEVKRVLKDDGTCWVNLGDTYYTKSGTGFKNDKLTGNKSELSGLSKDNNIRELGLLKPKNLVLIPFRFALEMQARGWIVRNVIIWHKPNCMPSSTKDRFTNDFEYIFFFAKNRKYYFEQQFEGYAESTKNDDRWGDMDYVATPIKEGYEESMMQNPKEMKERVFKKGMNENGRNKRAVWSITTKGFRGAHFATFCEELIDTPIKTTRPDSIILDLFSGSGTTLECARDNGRNAVGIEINPKYVEIILKRLMYDHKGNRNLYPEPEVIC